VLAHAAERRRRYGNGVIGSVGCLRRYRLGLMAFVLDTNSLKACQSYFPGVFKNVWQHLQQAVDDGGLFSVKEVKREVDIQSFPDWLKKWATDNRHMFRSPTPEEARFMGEQLFAVPKYRELIGSIHALQGRPVADPYLLAAAYVGSHTIITEEKPKPNSSKIPTIAKQFGIPTTTMEEYMEAQGWEF